MTSSWYHLVKLIFIGENYTYQLFYTNLYEQSYIFHSSGAIVLFHIYISHSGEHAEQRILAYKTVTKESKGTFPMICAVFCPVCHWVYCRLSRLVITDALFCSWKRFMLIGTLFTGIIHLGVRYIIIQSGDAVTRSNITW